MQKGDEEGRSRSWVICLCVWFGVRKDLSQKGPSHSTLPSLEVLVKEPGEEGWVGAENDRASG